MERPGASPGAVVALLACACNGLHVSGLQVNAADGVILGVGDVEYVAVYSHALRMVEGRLRQRGVNQGFFPGADYLLHVAVEGRNDDAVVVGVGDEQPSASLIRQDLAGEAEVVLRAGRRRGGQRGALHDAQLVELRHHARHQGIELLEGQLALVLADDVAEGVNEHQRGPGAAGILLPDLELGVVDYRMLQLAPAHGGGQAVGLFLGGELGRVNAHHHQLAGVLALQFPQLRKDVHTVHSTVGPEVEDDDLAFQFLHRERPVCVDPFQAIGGTRELASCRRRSGWLSSEPPVIVIPAFAGI